MQVCTAGLCVCTRACVGVRGCARVCVRVRAMGVAVVERLKNDKKHPVRTTFIGVSVSMSHT